MKQKGIIIVLALACVLLTINSLLTSFKYGNDFRMLMALQSCSPGLSSREVEQAINSSITLHECTAEDIEHLTGKTLLIDQVRYCSTKYMGVITSRILILLFDKDRVLLYATWANT